MAAGQNADSDLHHSILVEDSGDNLITGANVVTEGTYKIPSAGLSIFSIGIHIFLVLSQLSLYHRRLFYCRLFEILSGLCYRLYVPSR